MADGTVTIKAKFDGSEADKGVSKLKDSLNGMNKNLNNTGGLFKKMVGANLVSSAIGKGINLISRGVGEMVEELNASGRAWKTFEGNMKMIGKSSSEIDQVRGSLQKFAQQSIFSASDMASTYSQMASIGVENAESLVKGLGGIASSAENPKQAMKTLSTQMTQALSKPTIQWQDFQFMLAQAPAGMAAVAKEMGMTSEEMVTAIKDGEIASKDFAKAVDKVGNSRAFRNMATEFKTVGDALDGLKEGLTNKLQPAFDKATEIGIKGINKISDSIEKIDFSKMAKSFNDAWRSIKFSSMGQAFATFFHDLEKPMNKFKTQVEQAFNWLKKGNFEQAFKKIGMAFSDVFNDMKDAFVNAQIVERFGNMVNGIKEKIMSVDWAGAFQSLSNIGSTIQDTIFNSLEATSWGEVAGKIITGIADGWINRIELLGNVGRGIYDYIVGQVGSEDWGEIANWVFTKIGNAWDWAKTQLQDAGNVIKSWVMEKVGAKTWDEVPGKIFSAIGNGWQKAKSLLGEVGGAIRDWIFSKVGATSWGEVAGKIFGKIGESWDRFKSSLGDVGNKIHQWISTNVGQVNWSEIPGKIFTAIGNAWDGAMTKIGDIGSKVKTYISDKFNSVNWSDIPKNMGESIGNALGSLPGNIINKLNGIDWSEVGNTVGNAIVGAFEFTIKVDKFIGDMVKDLYKGFMDAKDKVIQYAKEFVNGIKDGIINALADVDFSGAIDTFVQKFVVDFFKAFDPRTWEWDFGGNLTKPMVEKLGQAFDDINPFKPKDNLKVESEVGEVTLSNSGNIRSELEAEIRQQVSGTEAEVDAKVKTLLDYLLDEKGNLSQKVQERMRSENISGEVDAKTLVDYFITNDGDLFNEVIENARSQMANQFDVPAFANPDYQVAGGASPEQAIRENVQSGAPYDAGNVQTNANVELTPQSTQGVQIPHMTGNVGQFDANASGINYQGNQTLMGLDGKLFQASSGQLATNSPIDATNSEIQGSPSVNPSVMSPLEMSIRSTMENAKTLVASYTDGMVNTFNTTWSKIASTMGSSTAGMIASIRTLMESIKTTIASYQSGIQNTFKTIWTNVASTTKSSFSQVVNSVKQGMNSVKQSITSSMSAIQNSVRSGMESVNQAFSRAMSSIVSSIQQGCSRATSVMQQAVNRMVGIANAGASQMYNAGRNIGQGLANGMMASLGAITSAANAMVAQALRATRARAMIHSPSRLFEKEVGAYLPQGTARGIDKNIGYVEKSAKSMINSMMKYKLKPEDLIGVGGIKMSGGRGLGLGNATNNSYTNSNTTYNTDYTINAEGLGGNQPPTMEQLKNLLEELTWLQNLEARGL